ncbi:PREDICTED: protein MALE DISCOVERER 1-like [Nelumbo nucifera]|uniref:Protein MALE DISCOVERER 1-like n=1 Tax=Nelumbo nucifera TaxID=4432 RepID=A0A1U8B153_NELNU|nr:PREDICTED: protein MALE DISCOVERER 1-like [Nelumbo nucifera]XP_019055373.1 PREDICTED: protein MALE DISCOVERER 1-like [Nelumbo nucifera]
MDVRWNPFGFQLHMVNCFFFMMLLLEIQQCWTLNVEGLALLEFRARIDSDPYGVLSNWNPNDRNPCTWSGVHCVDGKVQMLDLQGLSLGGILAPDLGNLINLKSLVLYKNHFTGVIPKEIGSLRRLELLDLRDNSLNGTIPAEIGMILSLKRLLLCNNNFQGRIPIEFENLNMLSELQFDQNLKSDVLNGISCLNRKIGYCIWESSLKHLNKANSLLFRIKGRLLLFYDMFTRFKFAKGSLPIYGEKCCNDISGLEKPYISQNVQEIVNFVRRRLLQESSNLPAMPASGNAISEDVPTIPITRSSGAFPAIPNAKKQQYPPPPSSLSSPSSPPLHQFANSPVKVPHNQQPLDDGSFGELWKYAIVALMTIFLIIVATMLCKCRSQGVTTITPWKTGLSGQLQKAFITGAPKLNRPELETACEDFSNIIETFEEYTIFKGTLSSGVEIAVLSTAIVFSKDWAKCMEKSYRKKIDTLSRVNHKNFVNLLGYCEEEEPFTRMMVFEYAPNGTLFQHLHVKEFEHLDWNARMRIIMGISYCLQYMHHDLNPPVAHSNLQSSSIYLTDDHAAKIGEVCLTIDARFKSKTSIEDESEHSELPPLVDPETNVYSFGMLLIEIISGKLQCSEEGPLLNWASKYLDDKCNISKMVDPTLKSFKNDELDIICEVIQECINQDPRKRPTMREVTSKLREVIAISPEAATPRLSPLWWAELEILSVEGT